MKFISNYPNISELLWWLLREGAVYECSSQTEAALENENYSDKRTVSSAL